MKDKRHYIVQIANRDYACTFDEMADLMRIAASVKNVVHLNGDTWEPAGTERCWLQSVTLGTVLEAPNNPGDSVPV